MSIESALQALRRDAGFMRNTTTWQQMPALPPRSLPLPVDLNPGLAAVLRRRGIGELYTHQMAAWQAARRGEHLVVVTPTASGKTLCYNLPVLHALLADPDARALYLFPTKALAQDQLAELTDLELPIDGRPLTIADSIRPAAYDGDTPQRHRARIRERARVVLTNPDMLHTGILPHHPRWASFFANLRFVVVDELHAYRGVFGSHFANVLRRLRRICQFHGGREPQFLCASATIANPGELAGRLLEAPVTVIDDDGSPKGERHFVFYNPPMVDPALGLRRSSTLEAELLAARLIADGVQTIVFARSRLTMEVLLTYLRERIGEGKTGKEGGEREEGKTGKEGKEGREGDLSDPSFPSSPSSPSFPSLPSSIAGYRSGYLPAERRAIERGLRTGSVRGVVATNALELGVNIGGLDAAVLTGFPGTIASTWQQAGRAGRRGGVSLAILVATAGALDQYLITHPDYFFGRSPEHALINPDNLVILSNHVACAAFELPFRAGERFGAVDYTDDILRFLAESGDVQQHGGDWFWMGEDYPAQRISLRTGSPDNVVIQARLSTENSGSFAPDHTRPTPLPSTETETAAREGKSRVSGPRDAYVVIGEIERAAAPMLLHEGAVYLHGGESYLVERLDWDNGQAWVTPASVDYYTQASGSQQVHVLGVHEQAERGGVQRAYGPVQVVSQFSAYRKVKLHTHETLGYGEITLPEQVLETEAYWLAFTDELLEPLRAAGQWRSDPNDYGPNWPQQRAAARARDGFRCAICGAAEPPNRQHDVHHKRPFRAFNYVPGVNQAYREANQLDNLVTLCRSCHQMLERGQRLRTGLGGLAYVLGNVAPLHLMCDPADIGVISEAKSPQSGRPTITVYEKIPAGIGFSQRLYELHDTLLAAAGDVVRQCLCRSGCPACVGPVSTETEADIDPKALTLALIDACQIPSP